LIRVEAQEEITMGSLVTLNLPTGKVGFKSTVLGWDEEPRDAFRVELPDRPTLYGEWRPKFADNENDFDVEIVGVGYANVGYVGSPLLAHRKKFSAREQSAIEELIRALFADQTARAAIVPFSSKTARFLGVVIFAPGWILRSDE
jgi:hypothetical protein